MNARDVMRHPFLSFGAKQTALHLLHARPGKRGVRRLHRRVLAKRLRRSERQVSRYIEELKRHQIITVIRPRRERRGDSWRSIEPNGYTLNPGTSKPHNPRSRRHDTGVTPPLLRRGYGAAQAPTAPDCAPVSPPATAERRSHWSDLCRAAIREGGQSP